MNDNSYIKPHTDNQMKSKEDIFSLLSFHDHQSYPSVRKCISVGIARGYHNNTKPSFDPNMANKWWQLVEITGQDRTCTCLYLHLIIVINKNSILQSEWLHVVIKIVGVLIKKERCRTPMGDIKALNHIVDVISY